MKYVTLIFLLLLGGLQSAFANSTLSGSAFLKTLPGSRAQSMGSAYTAVIDDPHAVFANPGTAGFLREWQWTTSYTKWFADVNHASFIYGHRLRTPWSRQTRLALGVLYQGVPSFDSTHKQKTAASASDMLASLSIGQPLSFISDNVSIGANLKYFNSQLATFSDAALVYDAGIAARTRTFHLNSKWNAAFSFGAAVTQMGPDMTFVKYGTPLPLTQRIGAGFYFGTHHSSRFLVTADYVRIKDFDDFVTIGAEANLFRFISFNTGWDFRMDLMHNFTVGFSLNLDDAAVHLGKGFPARNQYARLDFSTLDDSRFVGRTYRGSTVHAHNNPESFRFKNWCDGDTLLEPSVTLKWEYTLDRDVFDAVRYHFVLDQDREKLKELLNAYENHDTDFYNLLSQTDFAFQQQADLTQFKATQLKGGHWYWLVLALDRDDHVRFANYKQHNIAHFYKPMPDIKVSHFKFDYFTFITQDDYHGMVSVDLENAGDRDAYDVEFEMFDVLQDFKAQLPTGEQSQFTVPSIDTLKAGEIRHLEFEWHTPNLGKHQFQISAHPKIAVEEWDLSNNTLKHDCYTIPKGYVHSADTTAIHWIAEVTIELPIITEINFDINSTLVPPIYLHKDLMEPHLFVLAERLRDNHLLSIDLTGFIDQNSGEYDVSLADRRALAVRDSLLELGVLPGQINILKSEIRPKRHIPANKLFTKWIKHEQRGVKVTATKQAQKRLFQPIIQKDVEMLYRRVPFDFKIQAAVPTDSTALHIRNRVRADTAQIDLWSGLLLDKTFKWQPKKEEVRRWNNRNTEYDVVLVDSLKRTFMSYTSQIQLVDEHIERESHRMFPAVFAKTNPTYDVFWEDLYIQSIVTITEDPDMRMRFEGHACAIDPVGINQRLSEDRANTFHNNFLQYVQEFHPEDLQKIKNHLDVPLGYGSTKPMGFHRLDGTRVILGDNKIPLGRKLNRRIEVIFTKTF